MRVAILFAPEDHDVAERVRFALGDSEAFLAAYESNVVFGPQLVLLAVWTRRAAAHAQALRAFAEARRGVVIWRADGAEAPAGLESFSVCADASPRDLAAALKLAEMQIVRAADDDLASRRRHPARRVALTVAGAGVALALGAAGAAAFMLDGEDALSVVQGRVAAAATH